MLLLTLFLKRAQRGDSTNKMRLEKAQGCLPFARTRLCFLLAFPEAASPLEPVIAQGAKQEVALGLSCLVSDVLKAIKSVFRITRVSSLTFLTLVSSPVKWV